MGPCLLDLETLLLREHLLSPAGLFQLPQGVLRGQGMWVAEEGGERDKSPDSFTSMTTYVEDISFLFQD